MCENCVAAGRMTQAEADAQKAELSGVIDALGMSDAGPVEILSRLAVQGMGQEFMANVTEIGYELSVGRLKNGNVAVGLIPSGASGPGMGYVMAEFSADNIRRMLDE